MPRHSMACLKALNTDPSTGLIDLHAPWNWTVSPSPQS
jgi:hypothetical protein